MERFFFRKFDALYSNCSIPLPLPDLDDPSEAYRHHQGLGKSLQPSLEVHH